MLRPDPFDAPTLFALITTPGPWLCRSSGVNQNTASTLDTANSTGRVANSEISRVESRPLLDVGSPSEQVPAGIHGAQDVDDRGEQWIRPINPDRDLVAGAAGSRISVATTRRSAGRSAVVRSWSHQVLLVVNTLGLHLRQVLPSAQV